MKITADVFARVYQRISESVLDIDIADMRDNGGKLMNLLLGKDSLKGIVNDAKTMIALIRDFVNNEYRDISWATVGAIIVALVYLVAPVDLIPDFIPVVGMVDDLFLFRIALAFVQDDLEQYAFWKRNSDIDDAEVVTEDDATLDDKIEANA